MGFILSIDDDRFSAHLRYDTYVACDTGNNPSLTAATVVVTGLTGANFAQIVMDKFGFQDSIARGMATAARFVAHPCLRHLHRPPYFILC